ncbi:multicopper oxidase family protein [Streptomyces sp. NPDC052309]|uniref:multicopper oxidase family protein n=1 Tax=Streptomyces sp. NPDC052309 TaxID=3155421 RepID=UPI0034142460
MLAVGSGILAGCSESGPDAGTDRGPRTGPGTGSEATPRSSAGGHSDSHHGHRPFVPKGPDGYVDPSGPEVLAVEKRRGTGPVRKFRLTTIETSLDLGGRKVRSWAYGDTLPGREIRITAGDILDLTLANHLREDTTLHAHGVRMRCDMDGVPDLTQAPIKPGTDFTYRFAVTHPGTYWLHSHSGMQLDRGLYAPLIVDDPKEPLSYDKEWTVLLDDWLDGVGGSTPDGVLARLQEGRGSSNRILHHAPSRLLQGVAGHVDYPYYLINGRLPKAPTVFKARPGDRIRLRIINAGAETAFRVALGGHKMTVTHTDGYPVEHRKTDALLIGMAERYDVLVTAKDGVFPLVALAEGKRSRAMALLRTGKGKEVPPPSAHPRELDGAVVPARRLRPHESVALRHRKPDREIRIRLTGNMREYNWGFDHKPHSLTDRHPVRQDERVRISLINATDMWHPLHLHGHTFAVTGFGAVGARKDTAVVLPHRKLVVDFDADNPGLWMLHCHNQYHSETGMMTILGYRK